jgi:hypothetical protein
MNWLKEATPTPTPKRKSISVRIKKTLWMDFMLPRMILIQGGKEYNMIQKILILSHIY